MEMSANVKKGGECELSGQNGRGCFTVEMWRSCKVVGRTGGRDGEAIDH